MPIYEYECERCGVFDILQLAGEKPLRYCPTCEKKKRKSKVQKVVSASSFHLKGTGWYKTDYANTSDKAGKGKKENKAESSVAEPSKSSEPTKASSEKDSKTNSSKTKPKKK